MSPLDRHERWSVPALLAGLTLFFYWKILFTNHFLFPYDAAEFFYPFFSFVHEELRHFRLPLWDPDAMSGFPIIGDPESQIFYPINWLFVLVHPLRELPYKLVEIQLILHFFLAGLFMYYLARSMVQSSAAALCGAVLFMFSGAMVVHTQHVASIDAMAWYPLIFLLARRGLLETNPLFTVSAGTLFGIQILAGHWQHSVYLGLFLFLYFAYEASFGPLRAKLWPRWIYSVLLIGGIGAALAMIQIIPTYELGNLSVRSYLTYWDVTDGNEPRFLWTLFLPNYFGGLNGVPKWYPYDLSFNYVFLTVPGCLLALLGLVESVRRRNFFWLGMVLLSVSLSFGRHGYWGAVLYQIPILNLFRNMAMFFDLANFSLCLMAALGAERLFSKTLPKFFQNYLPAVLAIVLFSAAALGLILRFGERIHGWHHMLFALALVSVVVTARLRNSLSPAVAQWAILGLMVFDLFFYQRNQTFNAEAHDPREFLSRDVASNQRETLRFLRSDPAADFRMAAIASSEWSGNGPNIFRIPGIYGWNPITLRRYDEYLRGFTESSSYALPHGSMDHNLESSLFDLLGTKYLVMANPVIEEKLRLRESGKFEMVFEEQGWLRTYRNKNYLSRAWFFPRAYIVPNEEQAFALMSSHWFEGRRTLLFEKGELPSERTKLAEELSTVTLGPKEIAAASSGYALTDPYCSEPLPIYGAWGEKKDDWFRYDVRGPAEAGRALLLMRYTAARQPTPSLDIEIQNGGRSERAGPVPLPGTMNWDCAYSRTAELGTFELAPGPVRLTITTKVPSDIHIYSLWLVRLPSPAPPETGTFSFDDFSVSANRISFRSHQSRDGFLLLNEIHYPGWEAAMDGKPVEILRADGIFRALFVPAGNHRLEFRFQPRHFVWGAGISLLTLAAFLAYSISYRQRKGFSQGFLVPSAGPHKSNKTGSIA